MEMSNYILFLIVGFFMAVTPGPSTLFALSQGLAFGLKGSLPSVGGLVSGNFFYGLLSIFGITKFLITFPSAIIFFKFIGLFYLIYLTYAQFSKKTDFIEIEKSTKSLYFTGFALAVCNPAFVVFYFVFLPQFIDPNLSLKNQIIILNVTQFSIDTICVFFYALASSPIRSYFEQKSNLIFIDKLSGFVLLIASLIMLFSLLENFYVA